MIEISFQDTTLFQFPQLADQPRLVHAVTAKPWNLAPHRGPEAGKAVPRRRALCDHLGISFDRLTAPEQVHGPEIIPVAPADIGVGESRIRLSLSHRIGASVCIE